MLSSSNGGCTSHLLHTVDIDVHQFSFNPLEVELFMGHQGEAKPFDGPLQQQRNILHVFRRNDDVMLNGHLIELSTDRPALGGDG